ncbi:MAG: hypothetical protein FJW66_05455 [Actinobacteria bacterium]|nr:hypothetical protein [Actinomycetota bacterium]
MGFLKNLRDFFTMPASTTGYSFIRFDIRCNRCGEEIIVKLRKTSDISRIYEGDEGPAGASFFVRKEILGNRCNNLIYLTAYFNESFNLISRDITGGRFLD